MQQISLNKQLVLIGGGHSNVQVLRKLCMHEYKGLNVILISESYGAIYSGMTPGYIEKLYSLDDITIDLQRLCFNAGATFIKDKVVSLDEENKIIHLKESPSISFDILSINSGSISNKQTIQFENDSKVISVKPIGSLVSKLEKIDEVIEKSSQKKISIEIADRRKGDPGQLVADNKKIKKKLNWSAQYSDLKTIISSAWNWEQKLLHLNS